MMKNILAAAGLLMIFWNAAAQEIEFPLSENPVIKEYLKKAVKPKHASAINVQSSLSLPFLDDFSGSGIFPNTVLWVDSDAFINQTMCDHPISIGVATLDGINKYGQPHDSLSSAVQPVICDYLTSQPIDLSTVASSDSVYFSFFYQPQGLGDEPEEGDSLVLQFYGSDGTDSTWNNIWVAMGSPNTAFQEVRIKIDSIAYFWPGFQFRFYNYATPNGNRDHWNLDYINLAKNMSINQPLYEITLVDEIPSYLSEFTSMPYSHYKHEVSNGNNPVKNQMVDTIRVHEMTGSTASATINFSVTDKQGNSIFNQSNENLGLVPNTSSSIDVPLPSALFPSTSADFIDFFITHQMSTVASGWTKNDTSYGVQHFYNYYAFDDGSAESATGVHVAYTKYAYQIDVKKADSLIGISIYFNPWGRNVHQDLFSLCMWDNIQVGSNSDVLVHQTIDKKPSNNDSINGFVDYYLDYPVFVTEGMHYFGIIQSSVNEIGIGVDHNTDNHTKMFLNYNNQWYHSTITGSWMMRPLFGKVNTIGIDEIAEIKFDIFPNPANTNVIVETSSKGNQHTIHIYNMIGELMFTQPLLPAMTQTTLDISSLTPGVYFVQLSDESNVFTGTKKLVVTR